MPAVAPRRSRNYFSILLGDHSQNDCQGTSKSLKQWPRGLRYYRCSEASPEAEAAIRNAHGQWIASRLDLSSGTCFTNDFPFPEFDVPSTLPTTPRRALSAHLLLRGFQSRCIRQQRTNSCRRSPTYFLGPSSNDNFLIPFYSKSLGIPSVTARSHQSYNSTLYNVVRFYTDRFAYPYDILMLVSP